MVGVLAKRGGRESACDNCYVNAKSGEISAGGDLDKQGDSIPRLLSLFPVSVENVSEQLRKVSLIIYSSFSALFSPVSNISVPVLLIILSKLT